MKILFDLIFFINSNYFLVLKLNYMVKG